MKRILVLFFVCFTTVGFSQKQAREYQSHKEENGVFEVTTTDGTYLFKIYSNSILETTFLPTGELPNETSHAVIIHPKKEKAKYSYQGEIIEYGTNGISVQITT